MPDTDTQASATEPKSIDFTIQGFTFSVTPIYKDGDVINAIEAGVLDQTRVENIRNNFAQVIKAMKTKVAVTNGWVNQEGEKQIPDTDRVANSDLDFEELQTAFEAYVDNYEFGSRRAGGVRAPVDPVEREAERIAKEKIKEQAHKQGIKFSEIPKETLVVLVQKLLEKESRIRQIAKERINAIGELDLGALQL